MIATKTSSPRSPCTRASVTNTRTKLTCNAANGGTDTSACYAGFFQYRSTGADTNPDAFEQPSADNSDNLMLSDDDRMQEFPEWTAGDYSITYERWTRLATKIQRAATSTTSTTRSPSSRSWVRTR